MSGDVNDEKTKAFLKGSADPVFLQALSTNIPLQSNADFADLLKRLEIAEAQYNRHNTQSEDDPFDPPEI